MKIVKNFFLVFLLFFFCSINVQALDLELYSENIILYNLDENKILYEQNSKEQISIASMTKIMTAIVAIEHIQNLDEIVTLTSADFYGLAEANASVAGFRVGQKVTYRDLLYGLLLPSGADAALALTRNVAGGREAFLLLMNQKAKELGLENTHFMNETGLDEEGHYSTVQEVALLFQYALQNEEFRKIITTDSYQVTDGSLVFQSTIYKNEIRYGLNMEYLLGGKTGSTYDAGLCLASIASSNGTNYMLITARAPYNRTPYHLLDAKTIYEYFIGNYKNQNMIEKGDLLLSLHTKYAKEEMISYYAKETISKYVEKEFQKDDLDIQYDGIIEVTPFMKKGSVLGTLMIQYQNELIMSKEIILEEVPSLDLWKYGCAHKEIIIFPIAFFLSLILLIFYVKKRKKK